MQETFNFEVPGSSPGGGTSGSWRPRLNIPAVLLVAQSVELGPRYANPK